MPDITELYQFRSLADGEPSPAPSRYRAVRNALASSARGAQDVSVERRLSGNNWDLDPEGMAELSIKLDEAQAAKGDTTTLEMAVRQLGNVCRLLSGHKTLTDVEAEVLAIAIMKVTALIAQGKETDTNE